MKKVKKAVVDFNHLIFYAKGWYKHSDNVIDDVRKIFAERSYIHPDHLSDNDVWQCCVMALKTHSSMDGMERFLNDLFKPEWEVNKPLLWFSPECSLKQAISKVLSVLSRLKVIDNGKVLLELGKPKSKVLPLIDGFKEKWSDTLRIQKELTNGIENFCRNRLTFHSL